MDRQHLAQRYLDRRTPGGSVRIPVVADSHGDTGGLRQAIRRHPDVTRVMYCGDDEADAVALNNVLPSLGFDAVLCSTNADCKQMLNYLAVHNVPAIVRDIGSSFNILEEKVKVMTIHSSKGLEFPVVFALGWHEGTLPMLGVRGDPAEEALELENERRLAYVAMTRASEALYLVTSPHKPSRFLDEIPEGMKLVERVG